MDPSEESDRLRVVFDQLRSTRGRVPSMYVVLAHQPEVLAAHRAYFHAALDTGLIDRALKEKVAFKVAGLCGSAYSSASHRRYAIEYGVTEEELLAIQRSDYGRLDQQVQIALEFAEEVIERRLGPSDAVFEDLARHFPTAEIVELSALVGIMQLASTLGAIFGLEPDGED